MIDCSLGSGGFGRGWGRFTTYLRLGLDLGGKFVGLIARFGRDLGSFTAYL